MKGQIINLDGHTVFRLEKVTMMQKDQDCGPFVKLSFDSGLEYAINCESEEERDTIFDKLLKLMEELVSA